MGDADLAQQNAADSDFDLGNVLIIANPAAQSGKGARGAELAERFFEQERARIKNYKLYRTCSAGDAVKAARDSASYDTVIALGGDGIIHEVVNGLMAIEAGKRPSLGIAPLGSGNDYARTLGVARNAIDKSLSQLVHGRRKLLDVGLVNGVYFMQTLSFGFDAAIALGSMQTRTKSGSHGTRLYGALGLDIFSHTLTPYSFEASFDGVDMKTGEDISKTIQGEELVFAVQVGPSYGGGFRVCPKASPCDGLLDLCRSIKVPSVPYAMSLFALARLGLHTHSRALSFERVRRMTVDFAVQPPCQVDGEPLEDTHFEIESCASQLNVVTPATF